MFWRDPSRDERGIAMVSVIVIGAVIVLVLSTLALRNASDLNQIRGDRLREQALHTGDGGIDQTLAFIKQNRHYNTGVTLPAEATSWERSEERAWVLSEAEESDHVLKGRDGEWVVVKPRPDPSLPAAAADCPVDRPGDRDPSCVIYSVGFTPVRDPARRVKVRVLKADYALGPRFSASKALLTEGNLTLKGNLQVTGSHGSAHANGNVTVNGNPSVSGTLSASKSCSNCANHDGDTDPSERGNRPPEDIPLIDPRQAYSSSEFDLCPDGTVRPGPSNVSPPPEGTTQPCSPTVPPLADTKDGAYRGWSSTAQSDSRGRIWTYSAGGKAQECDGSDGIANDECDGVFYVYQGSVNISGNPGKAEPGKQWHVTILAEAEPTSGPVPHDHCPHTYGDITFSGRPNMRYHDKAEPLLLVAGRNLTISGSVSLGSFDHQGALAAHGWIRMTGTPGINGPVISNDSCPGSTGGIEDTADLNGNVKITYNGGLTLPFGTAVSVTNWIEL